ncbi:hypothetical protein POM88_025238 [Heracleum sosnowskyi]|uniref:Uncharacterized protein n=1 Tax=Heracleum sosnowskyi TaxID=360622 RepID=A0AAD8I4W0_9APIA|nr:hypothetical protein POM88_025238 [Heracleum sosnowskyi]
MFFLSIPYLIWGLKSMYQVQGTRKELKVSAHFLRIFTLSGALLVIMILSLPIRVEQPRRSTKIKAKASLSTESNLPEKRSRKSSIAENDEKEKEVAPKDNLVKKVQMEAEKTEKKVVAEQDENEDEVGDVGHEDKNDETQYTTKHVEKDVQDKTQETRNKMMNTTIEETNLSEDIKIFKLRVMIPLIISGSQIYM